MRILILGIAASVAIVSPALAQHTHPVQTDSARKASATDSVVRHSAMPGMAGMQMASDTTHSGMTEMSMGSAPLGISMQRMGSGTSWLPDATTMHASHSMLGSWEVMLHGVAFLQYDYQGTKRGDSQLGSVNWGMLMAGHDLAGGRLNLRGMVSAEALTVGSQGYPLLLQSGESYRGKPLYDRQHPHDVFMELAAMYDHAIGDNVAVSLYAAPVGEPAIGPVAFPHRPSAANNPLAPISHHWQDATHISFGVLTTGIYTRSVRLEASIFNGREPDEVRTNFDYKGRSLDSYAGRLTANPNENLSLSGSFAYLKSPEGLHPEESLHRISVSALYDRRFREAGEWSSAVIYGGNRHSGQTRTSISLVGESNLAIDGHNSVFGRAEFVEKGPEDLPVSGMIQPPLEQQAGGESPSIRYNVGEFTFGYVREVAPVNAGSLGIGAAGTINMIPATLRSTYGTRTPLGFTVFLRLRPGIMNMRNHSGPESVHALQTRALETASGAAR